MNLMAAMIFFFFFFLSLSPNLVKTAFKVYYYEKCAISLA